MIGNMNPLVAAQFIDHMDDKYENDPLYDNKAVEMEMKVLESAPPIPMKTCATNVQTAFVLGIVLASLSLPGAGLLYFLEGKTTGIISGVIGVLIQCILIFGADKQHRTAILVWMVLTILSCIYYAIMAIFGMVAIGAAIALKSAAPIVIFMFFIAILFLIGYIILLIWTIIVAKKARKEIEETENGSSMNRLID